MIGVYPFDSTNSVITAPVFIASVARVIGDVSIGEELPIWYDIVKRSDIGLAKRPRVSPS